MCDDTPPQQHRSVTNWLPRFWGMCCVIVGLIGLGVSIVLIVRVVESARAMMVETPDTLEQVERIVGSVRKQGQAADKVLGTTQDRVSYVGDSIRELSKRMSTEGRMPSLLLSIEEDIESRLGHAKQFVLSMQTSMRNLSSTLLVFDSMSLFGMPIAKGVGKKNENSENAIRTVASGLTSTADQLDQVTLAISKLEAGESINFQQLQIIDLTLKRVNKELEGIRGEVQRFSQEVEQTEQRIGQLKSEVPAAITSVRNMVVLVSFCFGFSQLVVACYGVRVLRSAH